MARFRVTRWWLLVFSRASSCPTCGDADDGDDCDVFWYCRAGLVCVPEALTAGCETGQCCTPLCDITGPPGQCPEPSEECVPWFEAGQAPDGLENVGYCGLP
jgi:hypothetical protein